MVQDTSLRAYQQILAKVPPMHRRILNVFLQEPGKNFTNRELCRETGIISSTMSARVNELRHDFGLLALSETRPCSITGYLVMAWQLSGHPTPESLLGVDWYSDKLHVTGNRVELSTYLTKEEWTEVNLKLVKQGYAYEGKGRWIRRK